MSETSQALLHVKKFEEYLEIFMMNQVNIETLDVYERVSHYALYFKLKEMYNTLKTRMSLNGFDNILNQEQNAFLIMKVKDLSNILDNPKLSSIVSGGLISGVLEIDNGEILSEKINKQIQKELDKVLKKF